MCIAGNTSFSIAGVFSSGPEYNSVGPRNWGKMWVEIGNQSGPSFFKLFVRVLMLATNNIRKGVRCVYPGDGFRDSVPEVGGRRRLVFRHITGALVPNQDSRIIAMVWADLLFDAEEATCEAVDEGTIVVCLFNLAPPASSLTMADESGTCGEQLLEIGRAHV